jgi:nuclear pore complex protein Nup98-Nup96
VGSFARRSHVHVLAFSRVHRVSTLDLCASIPRLTLLRHYGLSALRRLRIHSLRFDIHVEPRLTLAITGGFGANANTNTSSNFGSKPFGSGSTGGGLFGGGAASTGSTFGGGGGGFGSANTASSGFGANTNTGGSTLFGQQNKPAFGASTTSTGGMFGGGGNTAGGFGAATNTTGGFGAAAGGFGAAGSNAPNNGTASTPFQAHTEKDGTSATQHYQTITFQQPYTNYSLEELRVADYNQGRRYGNQNGQGGAFGQNTGFGGFGANNNTATNTTSGFGANTANTGGSLFGGGANTTSTTGGFGSNTGGFGAANNTSTGGGLFGQAKPATGGLFGGSNTTQTGSTGGLFGGGAATNTNTTGGFGSTGGGFGAAANTGGGLFGGANNQAKPAFGASTTSTSTPFGGGSTGGFGQQNTGGGGLFGQNNQASAAPSAFGTNTASAGTGGGLFGNAAGGGFGQNNQTQNQTQSSGGLFGGGGGGFGQNNQQNKPATGGLFGGGASTTNTGGGGLFGGASTTNTGGGGLFGQSTQQPQQQQQSGGLFGGGAQTNNTAGGGLFGAKPAATGGLFGAAPAANTGASTGGLFGNLGGQNNQQKPGGLFGSSTTNNAGGSLFGATQNNNNQSTMGGSLFGNQSQQQQNQQPNGNSLFGASGGSALMTTSLNTNAYGNDALFASLAASSQGPGPIATPLSSSQRNKKSAVLPQHKLNPAASTRLLTPQTKKSGGYGFSYSTYGSPSSISSAGPNLGGSLFAGGQLSRSLGSRSTSTNNLRNSIAAPEASILAPGAFSTTGRPFGNGSLKKLNVNRSINTRIPLFDEPSQKRVSFAGGDGGTLNRSMNGETALVVREDDGDASPKSVHDDAGVESFRSPQQTNGTEVALVSEDSALTPKSPSAVNIQPGKDLVAGNYWSSPPLEQLKKMSKQELKSVANFVVGRHNIGQIEFNHGEPVDLSETILDKLFGDIVVLNHRNATVYGENCTCLPKPALGTQLNRPSRIILGNSWPRNRAGKKDLKHLERLKRVAGTTFLSYNPTNGEWIFTVPHFSSYGLDYDQDYSDDEDMSSELSPVPNTPSQSQLRMSHVTSTPQQDSLISPTESSPDDTFDFKRGMRARASVPGGFGSEVAYEESDEEEEMDYSRGESFLGERSVGSLDSQQDADYSDESESESVADQSLADSVSGPIHTTEQAAARESDPFRSTLKPKSILKASMMAKPGLGTPSKAQAVFDDDWANQLQRTVSPRKQDRQALRETQGNLLREHDANMPTFSQSNGRHFTTAIDLMDSLFGQPEIQESPTAKRVGRGIEV